MSKPSEKKRRKQKTRKKAEAQKRLVSERRRSYREDFPGFVWQTNGAPPKFVEAVQQVVKDLHFRDCTVFPEWQADAFKAAKRYGDVVLMQPVGVNGFVQPVGEALGWHLGRTVFSRLPSLESWIPFNDVQFIVKAEKSRWCFVRCCGPRARAARRITPAISQRWRSTARRRS